MFIDIAEHIYNFFWGDLFSINLPNGISLGLSSMVILLISVGIYFTLRTNFLPLRLLPDILDAVKKSRKPKNAKSISAMQALIISTATRVGMGDLIGVAAAICAGGAGAVFWMWVTAIIGASTAFIESVLAQIHKEPDPLYGGWRGGTAYFIHASLNKNKKPHRRYTLPSLLFALSSLVCYCSMSQVIGNSVCETFYGVFNIKPICTALILAVIAAIIVLHKKNITVKVLDIMVPVMAAGYFLITIIVAIINLGKIPQLLADIFSKAFGLRQVVAGGFGAVLMNGVKRGLFSNEAGIGSATSSAAAAESKNPVTVGLFQVLGVFLDTIVCTCTAVLILLVPQTNIVDLDGMKLIHTVFDYHLGVLGSIFIAITLLLFSFSTFIGVLFYSRANVAYLFGDNWLSQNIFKILSLTMLFLGGISNYSVVWLLVDIGIAMMAIINLTSLVPLSKEALETLKSYEKDKRESKQT